MVTAVLNSFIKSKQIAAKADNTVSTGGNIKVEGVVKQFTQPDGTFMTALNNVDLDIEPGSFVSFIGPSGCGKSTLLRLIAGLEKPTEGTLSIDGTPITKPGYDRGLVFQNPTLFSWLNIYDNVAFSLKTRKIYKDNKSLVREYLELVGLSDFEKAYPHQLSGGMAQRAAIARALIGHPKVLLLDEPLGALDAFTRMNMQDEIHRIHKEKGMTTVMVTHDVDEAVYLSDKVVVMSSRPSKVEKIIDINLFGNRERNNPEFLRLRSEILEILHFAGQVNEPDYYI
ncbi:MAG TPA: ABC transporter ATP-binding protein [Lachnospiraceae bacterium]|nr:ABC transporter ATP-binding protein [Lachnospiraceae bacterium]